MDLIGHTGLISFNSLIGHNGLISFIGLGYVSFIGLRLVSLLVGGAVHSFPPFFFFLARPFFLFFSFWRESRTPKATQRQQKQTDAEQREALFSPR
jgi:hypothetical protein